MSYGALFIGNSGQLQIDQDYPCMHWVGSGSYAFVANTDPTVVTYATPINSPQPPVVFIKPDGAHIAQSFKHLGSAGNWTGFSISIYADSGFSGVVRSGLYKVAAMYLPGLGSWGLRVFDSSSRVVFDSNRELVSLISGIQTLTKIGYNGSYLGNSTTDTWAGTYVKGSYFMISHICAKRIAAGMSGDLGIGFLSGNSTTASQVCIFLRRLAVGQSADSNAMSYPLIYVN